MQKYKWCGDPTNRALHFCLSYLSSAERMWANNQQGVIPSISLPQFTFTGCRWMPSEWWCMLFIFLHPLSRSSSLFSSLLSSLIFFSPFSFFLRITLILHEEGLCWIASQCTQLRHLNLRDISQISDLTIEVFINYNTIHSKKLLIYFLFFNSILHGIALFSKFWTSSNATNSHRVRSHSCALLFLT